MYLLLVVIVLVVLWGLVTSAGDPAGQAAEDVHHRQKFFSKQAFLDTTTKVFEEVRHHQFIPSAGSDVSGGGVSEGVGVEHGSTDVTVKDAVDVSSGGVAVTTAPDATNARYAYVTLIHGIDETFRYRGYLYNVMIMKTALHSYGSEADLVVLIGFSKGGYQSIYQEDLDRLTSIGIKIVYLPRLLEVEEKEKVNFAEMALLKVTPFSFIQYEKIQFFDGDIMPTKNMDCYFELKQNTFNTGNASPLNSGWFLVIPNMDDFHSLRAKAVKRLNEKWSTKTGWGEEMPDWIQFRNNGKHPPSWNFNGASLDQGLLTHYFVINHGRVMLLDQRQAKKYNGLGTKPVVYDSLQEPLKCCNGKLPVSVFAHFTGKSKPWLNDIRKTNRKDVKLWGHFLDSLDLPVNSSNIHDLALKPPLGYFAPNV
jgi:hypothetical protein